MKVIVHFLICLLASAGLSHALPFAFWKAASGGTFTYHATGFSGDDRLERDGALTGITATNTWTVSFWFKFTDAAYDGSVMTVLFFGDYTTANPFVVDRTSGNLIRVACRDSSNGILVNLFTSATFTAGGGWHHAFISNNGTTSNLYIDGASDKNESSQSATSVPFTYTGTSPAADWSIGMFPDTNFPAAMKISELWFSNTYTAAPTNWRSGSAPANLGSDGSTPTGTAPLIYLKDPAALFATNSGTGGNFTVKTGTLTDEDADKP